MQKRIINATEASTQPEGPRIIKLVLADMDGTLLKKVPNSYAVANAAPEAKAAARHELSDAADDAVAQLLECLVAKQG